MRVPKENIGVGIMSFILLFIVLGVISFFQEADASTGFLLIFGVVIAVVIYRIVKKEFKPKSKDEWGMPNNSKSKKSH